MIKFNIGIPESTKAALLDCASLDAPNGLKSVVSKINQQSIKLDKSFWGNETLKDTADTTKARGIESVFRDFFTALIQAKDQSPGSTHFQTAAALKLLETTQIQNRDKPWVGDSDKPNFVALLPNLGERLSKSWQQLSEKINGFAEALQSNSIDTVASVLQGKYNGFDLKNSCKYYPILL